MDAMRCCVVSACLTCLGADTQSQLLPTKTAPEPMLVSLYHFRLRPRDSRSLWPRMRKQHEYSWIHASLAGLPMVP